MMDEMNVARLSCKSFAAPPATFLVRLPPLLLQGKCAREAASAVNGPRVLKTRHQLSDSRYDS
jgi:hypothetical protein